MLDEPGGLERTLRRAAFGITLSRSSQPRRAARGLTKPIRDVSETCGSGMTRLFALLACASITSFHESARFRSRSFCSITLTSGKFFLSASRKSAALPTITTLVGWARYSFANAVTASVVTASIDGIYLSSVVS